MLERIVRRMDEVGVYASEVNEESQLIDLGFNSLLLMEFLVLLEEEFDIEFKDEDMDVDNFASVKKIMELISKYNWK